MRIHFPYHKHLIGTLRTLQFSALSCHLGVQIQTARSCAICNTSVTMENAQLQSLLTAPFLSADLTVTKFVKPVESHDVPRQLQFHTFHSLRTLVARTGINRAECVRDGQTVYSYVAEMEQNAMWQLELELRKKKQ
jgi:hypothetical protein